MAHRKAGGSAKNLRDSQPKFLGIKLSDGARARTGAIIVRQRGTAIMAGLNVGIGKDHTLFALKPGTISFSSARKIGFNGKIQRRKVASVV